MLGFVLRLRRGEENGNTHQKRDFRHEGLADDLQDLG
jgi:hypothetical protein